MTSLNFALLSVCLFCSLSTRLILSKKHKKQDPWDCEQKLDVHNKSHAVKFDLCDFYLSNESRVIDYWTVEDDRDVSESNYTYYFNVVGNVLSVPNDNAECYDQDLRDTYSEPGGYCTDISDDGTTCNAMTDIVKQKVGAYQMIRGQSREHDGCWRLHDGKRDPIWSVLDQADPALGVSVTYKNGDYSSSCGANRDFMIRFECSDNVENMPDREEVITEASPCHYEFTIETTHGCPMDCPIVDDLICDGHGVCDFDFTNDYAKCYCYYGWYGDGCDSEDEDRGVIYRDDEDAYVGSLVVIILLLVIDLAILGYLFVRMSKLGHGYIGSSVKNKQPKRELIPDDEYDDDDNN